MRFTDDTLRTLGLNEAGVRAAFFIVISPAKGDSRFRSALKYNTTAEVDAVLTPADTVEVWWRGDCTPVRTWSCGPR